MGKVYYNLTLHHSPFAIHADIVEEQENRTENFG
jgi:hypothetical protein